MEHKCDRVSHLVRVARLRIETTVVEIEGGDIDEDDAEQIAIEDAELLPDDAWTIRPFSANDYRPHVDAIITQEEIAEQHQANRLLTEELDDAGASIRYLLLKANCDTAETELVLQPWLAVNQPDLLTSDLCRGWIGALQDLGLTHLSERLDDLAAGDPPRPSDQVLFNVKRSSKPKS